MIQVTNISLAGYFPASTAHPGAVITSLCHMTFYALKLMEPVSMVTATC